MSKELRNLLADVITIVEPFRDDISHILMKRTPEGDIAAAAKSRDSNISITMLSQKDVEGFEGVACFGSIPYLSAALNSSYIKDDRAKIDLDYDTASDGKTHALKSITFKGGRKLVAFYQATDPFINKMNRIKPPIIREWPIKFTIDGQFIKDFNEVYKVHRASMVGGDKDAVFTLSYSFGEIISLFGEKGHQSNMILSENAESTDIDKLSALMPITHFQAILKLIGKGVGHAKFTDKALRVDIQTELATYSLMILAKKVSR